MNLFRVKDGISIINADNTGASILAGVADPTISGTGAAAVGGSLYLKSDGVSYKKIGPADTDWQASGEIEGGGLLWSTISGATTAETSKGYILNSYGGAFTVTLPATPHEGAVVGFAGLGDVETDNITISMNGHNMNGSSGDLVVDLNYCYFEMLYTGDVSTGWILSNTDESGTEVSVQAFIGNGDNADAAVTEFTEERYITGGDSLETAIDKLDMALFDMSVTASGANDNYQYIVNVDTAHDNLAAAVLVEATTVVSGSSTGTVIDTLSQTGTLGAKWFVIAYDASDNRYACEIYAMHDGSNIADLTEYAILTIGTTFDLEFGVAANGTNMVLTVDNSSAFSITFKTQRATVSTAIIDTSAIIS